MSICSDSHEERNAPGCSARVVDADAVRRVRSSFCPDTRAEDTTAIFSALADRTRFRILEALSHEELCVCDIAELCGVSESGVSHQLRLLRDRKLVAFRRDGNRAVYRLADDHVRALIAVGLEHAEEGTLR